MTSFGIPTNIEDATIILTYGEYRVSRNDKKNKGEYDELGMIHIYKKEEREREKRQKESLKPTRGKKRLWP